MIVELAFGLLLILVLCTLSYLSGYAKGVIAGQKEEEKKWRKEGDWDRKTRVTYEPVEEEKDVSSKS